MLFISFQVDEIYHDESLGTNINIVLVRMIMVGYRQVSRVTYFVNVKRFQMNLGGECVFASSAPSVKTPVIWAFVSLPTGSDIFNCVQFYLELKTKRGWTVRCDSWENGTAKPFTPFSEKDVTSTESRLKYCCGPKQYSAALRSTQKWVLEVWALREVNPPKA